MTEKNTKTNYHSWPQMEWHSEVESLCWQEEGENVCFKRRIIFSYSTFGEHFDFTFDTCFWKTWYSNYWYSWSLLVCRHIHDFKLVKLTGESVNIMCNIQTICTVSRWFKKGKRKYFIYSWLKHSMVVSSLCCCDTTCL